MLQVEDDRASGPVCAANRRDGATRNTSALGAALGAALGQLAILPLCSAFGSSAPADPEAEATGAAEAEPEAEALAFFWALADVLVFAALEVALALPVG